MCCVQRRSWLQSIFLARMRIAFTAPFVFISWTGVSPLKLVGNLREPGEVLSSYMNSHAWRAIACHRILLTIAASVELGAIVVAIGVRGHSRSASSSGLGKVSPAASTRPCASSIGDRSCCRQLPPIDHAHPMICRVSRDNRDTITRLKSVHWCSMHQERIADTGPVLVHGETSLSV